ncbi:prepilin peptidase [Vreelandella massiliensis]|uniref:prepilin peptidase n=1 Tax=Vreelandella massiliensis TaxID=1816686 RepID=UPI00096A6149|nr:A24 family peptidase [Halomonas massiliensis]
MHAPPLIFWLIALVLGLCAGSFLNVVITRLPVMLMQQWRAQARAALELPEETPERFNIAFPASMCPGCRAPIKWHDNLPVLGWLKRRGRCAACGTRISVQYPLVELAGGAIALASLALYGVTFETLFIAGACLALLAMAVIDLRTQLLPDILTLPLLWAGLLYQLLFQPLMLPSAVIGAMAGYLILWSVYWLFKLLTGRDGMGYGDFKLLAALGAWLGWQFLPLVLIIAAGLGAIVGIALQVSVKDKRGIPMAFGPFLALAGWVALLGGDGLMALYLQLSGL